MQKLLSRFSHNLVARWHKGHARTSWIFVVIWTTVDV